MTGPEQVALTLLLNGEHVSAVVDSDATLVDALRESFGVAGVRIGCRNGDCGTCTALVDGRCVKTCLVLAGRASGREVRTLESQGAQGAPTAVQQGFMECYSFQCGFCLPGMIFAAEVLLDQIPNPTDADIRDALSGNLCRCTGYQNFIRGVHRAAEIRRQNGSAYG
jgi:aerobic-type carbon monoxide dehydrogenase small subunit (CoxS/CutS family)